MVQRIWDDSNFTFPYPIATHLKTNFCYNHLTVLEMLDKTFLSFHASVYLHLSTGLAGVLLPICVLLGSMANLILIIHVVAEIRLVKKLEYWAVFHSLLDILFMIFAGLIEAFVDFGLPWWNVYIRPVNQRSQLRCKVLKFTVDFFFTVRQNAILMMCIDQLYTGHHVSGKQLRNRILTRIVFTLTVTVIQVAPIALCYGLWVSHGRVFCSPDPQWGYVYIRFVMIHKLFYIDGNFQVLCISLLTVLIWRHLRSKQMAINFLRGMQFSKNLIGVIVSDTLDRLNQECINLKIIFALACLSILSRWDRLIVRVFHFYLIFGQSTTDDRDDDTLDKPTYQRLLLLCTICLLDVFEIIITSFTYLCWYTQVPAMRNRFLSLWKTLLHCRVIRANDKSDTDTIGSLNSRIIYDYHAHCRSMSKQLLRLQSHLRTTYAAELSDIRFRKISSAPSLE